jgi:hypothetical protein
MSEGKVLLIFVGAVVASTLLAFALFWFLPQ